MIKKARVDNLLQKGIFSQEDYDNFMTDLVLTDDGMGLIGAITSDQKILNKFYFDGDLNDDNLFNFVYNQLVPPLGAEYIDTVFNKYGMSITGVYEYWYWFTKENITQYAYEHGHKPIETASKEELWKMVALTSRYWEKNI